MPASAWEAIIGAEKNARPSPRKAVRSTFPCLINSYARLAVPPDLLVRRLLHRLHADRVQRGVIRLSR